MKRTLGKLLMSAFLFSSCKNEDNKSVLLNDIKKAGFPKNEVAVDFHHYFNGNIDIGSIAPNADPELQPQFIYEELKKLETDERTEYIYVRITDIEEEGWPYADAIYVVGSWTKKDLRKKINSIQPDEMDEGWMYDKPANITSTGDNVITLWWD